MRENSQLLVLQGRGARGGNRTKFSRLVVTSAVYFRIPLSKRIETDSNQFPHRKSIVERKLLKSTKLRTKNAGRFRAHPAPSPQSQNPLPALFSCRTILSTMASSSSQSQLQNISVVLPPGPFDVGVEEIDDGINKGMCTIVETDAASPLKIGNIIGHHNHRSSSDTILDSSCVSIYCFNASVHFCAASIGSKFNSFGINFEQF